MIACVAESIPRNQILSSLNFYKHGHRNQFRGIKFAVAWWAGTPDRVVVPAPQAWNRFLGSLKRFTNTGSENFLQLESFRIGIFVPLCRIQSSRVGSISLTFSLIYRVSYLSCRVNRGTFPGLWVFIENAE